MNNYEKIKNMTIEEMAEMLKDITDNCRNYYCFAPLNCQGTIEECVLGIIKQWFEQDAK